MADTVKYRSPLADPLKMSSTEMRIQSGIIARVSPGWPMRATIRVAFLLRLPLPGVVGILLFVNKEFNRSIKYEAAEISPFAPLVVGAWNVVASFRYPSGLMATARSESIEAHRPSMNAAATSDALDQVTSAPCAVGAVS